MKKISIYLIFVIILCSVVYAKVHYINTVSDSEDVAIGNNGELFVDNGNSGVGIGKTPSIGNKLDVDSSNGNAIYVKSDATSPLTYAIYAHSNSLNTYGVWSYSDVYRGGYFTSNGETVSAFSAYGNALKTSTSSGYAAIFNRGKLVFNGHFPVSDLAIGSAGLVDVGVFGQGETYGVYGNTTGTAGSVGVYGDGGSMGNGVIGISDGTAVEGVGVIGAEGISMSSNSRYGRLGTADYGAYGQYNSNIYGSLGGDYYGLYANSSGTGLYAYGDDGDAAVLNGDLIMSDGSYIELAVGDKNIGLSDSDPTWYGDDYGSVTSINGDGLLSSGLLSTGGINLSRHAVAEPVMGKWYLNSSDNFDGAGDYWDWDNEVFNTNTAIFSWTPGADTLTVNGASYPGFYEICWSLMYYAVAEGSYIYTNLRINGVTEYAVFTGGTQYAYMSTNSCAVYEFTSSQTVGFYAYSNDASYYHYGSTSLSNGRYSWWTIKRLN